MRTSRPIVAALASAFLLHALPALAADDAFDFYKEEAQVVTASRRPEAAWRAPAAVDVVTAEDIRAYGFKELWDALRYRAGMDVVEGRSLDGNRALVSARGFDGEFVTELLVLVDGRSVYSPFLGGVYWQSLPVQMQDIERIEIVRGPNAALYGSNAALGVINIITKKPSGGAGEELSAWGGSRSARGVAASAEASGARGGLRVSGESRADDGHRTAGDADGDEDDFLRLNKINVRGRWNSAPRTELEVLSGASWMTAGLPDLAPDARAEHVRHFEALRASHGLGGDAAVEASLSHSETWIKSAPLFAGIVDVRSYQYRAEVLHRFSWLDGRIKSNWGGEYRYSSAASDQAFAGHPNQYNRVLRGFTHHSVAMTDALSFVGGLSLEHSDTGGTQPAGQGALVLSPSPEHSIRASYSYAPTLPPLFDRAGSYRLSPTRSFIGDPGFRPEKISSWEIGWNGRLVDGSVRPGVTLYYMEARDWGVLNAVPGGPGVILSQVNGDSALARGAELSLECALGPGRAAFANYTLESITHQRGPSVTGEDFDRSTPVHKMNVGARTRLPRGFSAAAVLGYKDAYVINSDSRGVAAPVPRHFRLDARLGWSPKPGWELFVAGQELLQPTFTEYVDGTATARTVRAGIEARFGL